MCQVQKSRLCLGCFSCISFNTQDVFGVMPPIFAQPLFISVFQPTPASLRLESKLVSADILGLKHFLFFGVCPSILPSASPFFSVPYLCFSPSPSPFVLQGKELQPVVSDVGVDEIVAEMDDTWSKCSWCEAT